MSKCKDCSCYDPRTGTCAGRNQWADVNPYQDACSDFTSNRKQFINVPPKQKRESELKGIDDAGVV